MDNAGFDELQGTGPSGINDVTRRNTLRDGKHGDDGVTNKRKEESPRQIKDEVADTVVIEDNVHMKKQLGLPSGIAFIVGTMIGSGIFISPKGILEGTGSVGSSLLVWTGCGLISMAGALCFVELGTMIPKTGGEFAYLKESLGSLPAFFSVWIGVVISSTASQAINSLSFALYVLTPFFDECGPPVLLLKLLATATILTVCLVNGYSAEIAARVQVIFMIVKTSALCVIIVGGLIHLAQGSFENISTGFEGSMVNPSLIALAFYDGLWAYSGWNSLNYLTEELIKPNKNLPRAILIGVPLVMAIYLLTNISYLTVLSKTELLTAPAVAVAWGEKVIGAFSVAIPVAVAFSIFGALNATVFTSARFSYAAAREGCFPGVLSYVNVHRLTPWPSVIFTATISLILLIPGNVNSLINFVSFTKWLIYGATFFGLLLMRHTHKDWERPYRVPIVIPAVMVLVSIYLVLAPIIDNPRIEFLYATIVVSSGLIFYIPFVHFKIKLGFMDSFVTWVQLFLQVAPSKYEHES